MIDHSLDKLVELDYLSQERRDDIGNALLINTPQTQQTSSVLVKQEFSPDNANWDVNNSFCTGVTELTEPLARFNFHDRDDNGIIADNVWINGSRAQAFLSSRSPLHNDTRMMMNEMSFVQSTSNEEALKYDDINSLGSIVATAIDGGCASMEQETAPFTFNPSALQTNTDKWGKHIKKARHRTTSILKDDQVIGESAASLYKETKAMKMMLKMGYIEGKGLGKLHQGRVEAIETKVKLSNAGVGAPPPIVENKTNNSLSQVDETWTWTEIGPTTVMGNGEPVPREFSSFTPLLRETWKDTRVRKYSGVVVKFLQEGSIGKVGDIKFTSKIGGGLRRVTRRTHHLSQVMVEVVSGRPMPFRLGRVPPLCFSVGEILQLECQKGKVIVAGNRDTGLMGEIEIAWCSMDRYAAPEQDQSRNTSWVIPSADLEDDTVYDLGDQHEIVCTSYAEGDVSKTHGLDLKTSHTKTKPQMRSQSRSIQTESSAISSVRQYDQPTSSAFSTGKEPRETSKQMFWCDWERMTFDYRKSKNAVHEPENLDELAVEVDWSVVEGYVDPE